MYTHTYIDMYAIAYNVNTALSFSLCFSLSLSFFSLSFLFYFRFTLFSFYVSYLSTCLLSPCSWRRLLIEDRFCFVLKRARTHPNYVLYHVKNGNKVVDQFLFLTPCIIVFSPSCTSCVYLYFMYLHRSPYIFTYFLSMILKCIKFID